MNITDILIARSLAGGGGGGGASTAVINFWNKHGTAEIQVIAAFVGTPSYGFATIPPEDTYNAQIYLGEDNRAEIYIDPSQIPASWRVEVAGSAMDDGDGYYIVWGDASITINTGK